MGDGIRIKPDDVLRFGGDVQSTARKVRASSEATSEISIKLTGLGSGAALGRLVRNWAENTDIMADNVYKTGTNISRAARGWTIHDLHEAADYR